MSTDKNGSFPYFHLFWEMTRAQIKLRDQGTVLGFAWTLLHPALMFAVLYALFIKWMGKFVDQYAAYLLIGLVVWNFFQKGTSVAVGSLRRSHSLIVNYRFPREIIVLSNVAAVAWSSLLEFCVLLLVIMPMGVTPRWSWLFLPVPALILALLTTGLSLLLAVLAVEYLDMDRIWEVAVSALFYLTPIFYPLSIIGEDKRAWLLWNPLTQVVMAFRECLISGMPADKGVLALLLLGAGFCAVCGVLLLRRLEYRIADKVLV
ncbi:MAG: ABC transporter permease [Elusimicrobiota bacterium]|jgi:lipopolysaccharide transport system permease protein